MKGIIGLLLFMILIASCNAVEYTHQTKDIAGRFYDGGWSWGFVTITITGDSFHANYDPGSRLNPGTIDGTITKCLYPDNPQPDKIGWCINDAAWTDTKSVNGNEIRTGTVTFWISNTDIDWITGSTKDNNGNPTGSVTLRRRS